MPTAPQGAAPMGAARLAAEAAFFAAPVPAQPATVATVIVRRRRRPAAMPADAGPGLPGSLDPEDGAGARSTPRVFRLESLRPQNPFGLAEALDAAAGPGPGESYEPPAGEPAPRRRRRSTARQPGPVTQIAVAQLRPASNEPTLAEMAAALADVGDCLAQAQAAAAFDWRPAAALPAWQALRDAADRLQREIRAVAQPAAPFFDAY